MSKIVGIYRFSLRTIVKMQGMLQKRKRQVQDVKNTWRLEGFEFAHILQKIDRIASKTALVFMPNLPVSVLILPECRLDFLFDF